MKTMVASALAGLFLATSTAEAAPSAQEAAYIAKIEKRVRAALKDPVSARFSGAYVSQKGGMPVVCGMVNSKNSLGGYSGSQRFLAAGEIVAIDEQMANGEMDKLWRRLC